MEQVLHNHVIILKGYLIVHQHTRHKFIGVLVCQAIIVAMSISQLCNVEMYIIVCFFAPLFIQKVLFFNLYKEILVAKCQ